MQSIALDSNVQLFISDDSRLFLDSIFCQTYESIYLDYSNDQYKSYIYKPKNISYIIYTSGTTGKPKGVSITNDAIKNRMLWVKKYYNFSSKDSILLKYTIDFDPSISELFLPLISGGTMVVCPNKLPLSSSVIINYIEKYSISFINLVPITLRQILHQAKDNECTSLKHIICGGEAWEGELVNKTHKKFPNVSIYNGYGPTETTISVIVWKSTRAHLKGVPPIGKPIQNVHLLIVNEKGHSVNIGETGELWIGGVSVSPGYIGDNSKNSNFISVNVSTNKVIPFYKTGDLVKENPDGNLVYLGRIDNQASINGVRVELEEIESIALKINEVRDVLAIVDNVAGIDFIRLMYTTNSEKLVVKNKIIKIFSEKLRKEVIPTEIIHVEKIPTKINGKVDRSVR